MDILLGVGGQITLMNATRCNKGKDNYVKENWGTFTKRANVHNKYIREELRERDPVRRLSQKCHMG